MGAGLTRVSPTRLPKPSAELKTVLEERGVKMGDVVEQMMRVILPSGWGLYCNWDRGDIWRGYLLDDKGVQVAAITHIEHRPIGTGAIGPVVSRLRELYFDVVRGKNPKYRHWCTPVYAE